MQTSLDDGAERVFGLLSSNDRTDLAALYQLTANSPLWSDDAGHVSRQARQMLVLLGSAQDEGLDPADYHASELARLMAMLDAAPRPPPRDIAHADVALSRASLRYFRHVHLGRVDPQTVGFHLSAAVEAHDFATVIRSAVARDRIAETASELRPPFAQYEALRATLRRYRALAGEGGREPLVPSTAVVRPHDPYPVVDSLFRLLHSFGDLPSEASTSWASHRYEGALVEGVTRFQRRHGLVPDGVLGRETQAALRVPVARRVRQLELALERLRWVPDLDHERVLAINIPMFRLWAWDSVPPDVAPALAMDVIVGRALNTRTPVFDNQMREVIFRPYWNVPRSILVQEILPAVERNPYYLRAQDMEMVPGLSGDDAAPVETTSETLALLRKGILRLRQRPGPRNALGLVKFVFPNEHGVYLHGTPAQTLFSRNRRDFSHGCVRVADPVALAAWVLKERPEWTHDRILAAMAGTESLHVPLPRPVRVILFYTTATVVPEDGTIHFADDIYGHDRKLDQALGRLASR